MRQKRVDGKATEIEVRARTLTFAFHPEEDVRLVAFTLPAPWEFRVDPSALRVRDDPERFRTVPRGTMVKKRVSRRYDLIRPVDVRAGEPVHIDVVVRNGDITLPPIAPQLLVVFDDAKRPLV